MAWTDINNLTINAASANIVNPLGRGKTFDEVSPVGLRIEECFESTEMPAIYGTVMTITHGDLSSSQLFLQWTANGNTPCIYYRSRRNYNIEDWTPWHKVAYISSFDKVLEEQYAKLEAKVLSRIESNSLNTNDMQVTENQRTNGGGYFGYLNFKLGDYAVSVRQKGGQRNGLERYRLNQPSLSEGNLRTIRPQRIVGDMCGNNGFGYEKPTSRSLRYRDVYSVRTKARKYGSSTLHGEQRDKYTLICARLGEGSLTLRKEVVA